MSCRGRAWLRGEEHIMCTDLWPSPSMWLRQARVSQYAQSHARPNSSLWCPSRTFFADWAGVLFDLLCWPGSLMNRLGGILRRWPFQRSCALPVHTASWHRPLQGRMTQHLACLARSGLLHLAWVDPTMSGQWEKPQRVLLKISARCGSGKPMCSDLASSEIEIERSEEHTSELQSLRRISYAVFCLKKKEIKHTFKQQTYILMVTHKSKSKEDFSKI